MKLVVVLQDVFVFSQGPNQNETDCRCIGDIYKTTPDNSREVSEIDKFIDKAKQNIDTAIFTINMIEMQLSEVADFSRNVSPRSQSPRISSEQVRNIPSREEDNERNNK